MWRSVLSLLEPQHSPLPTHYKPARRPLQDLEAAACGGDSRSQVADEDGEEDYSDFAHVDQHPLGHGPRRSVSAGGGQDGSGTFHQLTLPPDAPKDGTSVVLDVDPGSISPTAVAAAQQQQLQQSQQQPQPQQPPQQQPQQPTDAAGPQAWPHRVSGGSPPNESSPTSTPTAAPAGPGPGPGNAGPNALRLSDYATSPPDQAADATAELRALAIHDPQKLRGGTPGPGAAAVAGAGAGAAGAIGGGRRPSHNIPPNGALGGLYGPGLFRHDSYPPPLEGPRPDATTRTSSSRGPPLARFEDLRFVQQIGEGGFGRVYYGYWQCHRVAIKLAHPNAASGPDMEHVVREFGREVAAMSALPPHKNVLQLLAACTEPPQLALVTDYCAAGSLYQLLHGPRPGGGAPPWPQLLAICLGVAQGMAWLHRHSILHRDLKSANILLDNGGNAKIADFGLARIYNGNRQVLTGGLGTYQWAAPEVLAHQRYSEKADVYSFGIVLWECLTRKLPYEGMTAVQAAVGVVTHGLRPDMPRDTPPDVAELVRTCWAAVPEQRPSFTQIEVQLGVMLNQARANAAAAAAAPGPLPGLTSASSTPRQGPVYGARMGHLPSPQEAGPGPTHPPPPPGPAAAAAGHHPAGAAAGSPLLVPGPAPLLPLPQPLQHLRPVAAPQPAGAVV